MKARYDDQKDRVDEIRNLRYELAAEPDAWTGNRTITGLLAEQDDAAGLRDLLCAEQIIQRVTRVRLLHRVPNSCPRSSCSGARFKKLIRLSFILNEGLVAQHSAFHDDGNMTVSWPLNTVHYNCKGRSN